MSTAAARTAVARTDRSALPLEPERVSARPRPRPVVTTGGRPAAARPRLLLPPSPEPVPDVVVRTAAALLAGPTVRSVLSPVTEIAWPVARPAATRNAPLPDPGRTAGSVALAALEALAGGRPVLQLARWVTPSVYEALARRCVTPGRPTRRPTVRTTVVSRISETVAEASVALHDGTRVRAAALRLEAHRGGWRVTVLQIG